MKKYSSTLVTDPDMKITSSRRLTCECGWSGTLGEATEVTQYNNRRKMTKRSYICNRCFDKEGDVIILLEDAYADPIGPNDSANDGDPRKNKDNV